MINFPSAHIYKRRPRRNTYTPIPTQARIQTHLKMGSPAPFAPPKPTDRLRERLGPRLKACLTDVIASVLDDIKRFLLELSSMLTSAEPRYVALFDDIAFSASVHEQYAVPKLRERAMAKSADGDRDIDDMLHETHEIRDLFKGIESLAGRTQTDILRDGSSPTLRDLEKAMKDLEEAMEEIRTIFERPVTPDRPSGRKRSISSPQTSSRPSKKRSFYHLDAAFD